MASNAELKHFLKEYMKEYGNQMIQVFGLGAEYLPDWADHLLDALMAKAEEVFEAGYPYYTEGEERLELLFVPGFNVWIIHYRGGVPGNETESIGVYDSFRRVTREYKRMLADMISDLRETIESLKVSGAEKEVINFYREKLRELRSALKRFKEEVK